jgi:hypothetical protein
VSLPKKVLLLWQASDKQTWAIEIPVKTHDNENVVYWRMRERFYSKRGWWQKYTSLYDIVEMIEVYVSARQPFL